MNTGYTKSKLTAPSSELSRCVAPQMFAVRIFTVLLFVFADGSDGFAFQAGESSNSLRSNANSSQKEPVETRVARRIQEKVQLLKTSTGKPIALTAPNSKTDVESITAAQERLALERSIKKRSVQPSIDDPADWPHVKAINNRIDTLKAILEKRNTDAKKAKTSQLEMDKIIASMKAEAAMMSPSVDPPVPLKEPVATELTPLRPSNPDPETMPSAESLPETSPTDTAQTGTIHTEIDSPKGVQIISTPVNSFELANSLLTTKNYNQALKSYQALLKEENSLHDTNWIRCLMANCYRMKGDNSKAESLYRDVLESKEKSHTAVYAKWFLDHLTQRQKLSEQLQTLDNELQANMTESSQ